MLVTGNWRKSGRDKGGEKTTTAQTTKGEEEEGKGERNHTKTIVQEDGLKMDPSPTLHHEL